MPFALTMRPFQGEEDYAVLAAILTASENADSAAITFTAEDVAKMLAGMPRFDIRRDLVIAESAGLPVGYAIAKNWEDHARRFYGLSGFVRPEWRRKGVGAALMDWLEARARSLSTENPAGKPEVLHVNTTQYQAGRVAIVQQRGYHPVESWSLMVRPSLADIPDLPLPAGLDYREEDLSAIWYAVEEAYVPEGGPPPTGVFPDDFRGANFQPELWQVAWESSTNRVVGSVMTYIDRDENQGMGILRGYTEGISTVPGWQHRGVAKALISRSLRLQRELGMRESGLVVSSMKPGSRRLYESCGFREVKRDTVYHKAMTPPPAEARP